MLKNNLLPWIASGEGTYDAIPEPLRSMGRMVNVCLAQARVQDGGADGAIGQGKHSGTFPPRFRSRNVTGGFFSLARRSLKGLPTFVITRMGYLSTTFDHTHIHAFVTHGVPASSRGLAQRLVYTSASERECQRMQPIPPAQRHITNLAHVVPPVVRWTTCTAPPIL